MKLARNNRGSQKDAAFAFTILEVMIALAIFFACVFGILALVSQSLRQARALRAVSMDARSAIALLSQTNRLEEGSIPLEIKLAFENENPGYIIDGQIVQVETNGLFQVEFYVGGLTSGESKNAMSVTNTVLFYRPMSQQQAGVRIRR